ncbi:MAG: GIY-YIG nuclease family protein [Alistipes sp.]
MSCGYVYILKCCNGNFYVGSTTNVDTRLKEHAAGIGADYVRRHLPIELVYMQNYPSIEAAFYIERQLHRWSHKKKQALIDGDYEALKQLSATSHPSD